MRNLLMAALVSIAGVVGLLLPVSVFNGVDSAVPCGNAVSVDHVAPLAPAVPSTPTVDQVIPHADLTAACASAIAGRRHWAVPLVLVGMVGMVGMVGLVLGVYVLRRPGAAGVR